MSNNNKQNLLTRADSAVIPQQKLLGLLQLIRLPPPSGHTMPGLPTKLDNKLRTVQRYLKLLEEFGVVC